MSNYVVWNLILNSSRVRVTSIKFLFVITKKKSIYYQNGNLTWPFFKINFSEMIDSWFDYQDYVSQGTRMKKIFKSLNSITVINLFRSRPQMTSHYFLKIIDTPPLAIVWRLLPLKPPSKSWRHICWGGNQWKPAAGGSRIAQESILPNFLLRKTDFIAIKLGHFTIIALFSYITMWESLTAKNR
jgi:hypothetical protein